MPAALVLALSLGLVVTALRARLRLALAITIGTVLLVPGTLVIPNGFTAFPTVLRVVSVALLVNVGTRVVRGELPAAVFRPRRVHLALAALIFVGIINGLALGIPDVPLHSAYQGFALVVDQLVFLVAVLAVLRALDDVRFAVLVAVSFVAVSALIATWEWVTHESWAFLFIENLPSQRAAALVQGLETRGGDVIRVRAASAFALEFGWLHTLLFPVALVVASRSRHKLMWAVPVLIAVTVYWSNSRSAVLGLAVGAVVVVALSRFDVPLTKLVATGAIVGVALILVAPSVRKPFTVAQQTGSIDVRMPRLKEAAAVTADDPYTGLGFRGLSARGVPIVDTSYMLTYAELGAIGLVVFLAVVLTAVGSTLPALRAPPGRDRVIAAAVVTGTTLTVMATGAYGFFVRAGSFRVFWLLVAMGLVLGERHAAAGSDKPPPRRGVRASITTFAAAAGLGLSALSQGPAAETLHFDTLPVTQLVRAENAFGFAGQVLADTVCDAAPTFTDADVECLALEATQDLGRLRIEGDSEAATEAAVGDVVGRLAEHFPGLTVYRGGGIETAQPTWGRTAPVALPLAAGLGVLLIPPLPLERSRRRYEQSARAFVVR